MDPNAGKPKPKQVERERIIHEVRLGDQVRVVIQDPQTGEEEIWAGLAIVFKPDEMPMPIAVPLGNVDVEEVLLQASYGLFMQRRAYQAMMQERVMQASQLRVPGGPGVQTPGGVFVPGPTAGRGRKQ